MQGKHHTQNSKNPVAARGVS